MCLQLLEHLLIISQILVWDSLDSVGVAERGFTQLVFLVQSVAILQ